MKLSTKQETLVQRKRKDKNGKSKRFAAVQSISKLKIRQKHASKKIICLLSLAGTFLLKSCPSIVKSNYTRRLRVLLIVSVETASPGALKCWIIYRMKYSRNFFLLTRSDTRSQL